MTQPENKLQLSHKWIVNNIQLIVLLPAVLGGLWQILELSSMSLSFIRFFSVTQVVADGLLILFVFMMFLIMRLITGINKSKVDDEFEVALTNRSVFLIILEIILWLGIGFLMCRAIILEVLEFKGIEFSSIIIFIAVALICLNRINYHFLKLKLYNSIVKFLQKIGKRFIVPVGLVLFMILVVLLPSLFAAFGYFRSAYLIPKNFKNIDNIKCMLNNEYNITFESTKIQYFNDKYIFVKYKELEIEKFVILDFDVITKKSDCK